MEILMKNLPGRRSQRGFSLIELMVVISIMTLVSALVLPQYVYLKIRAGRAEMLANMNTIYALQNGFHAENSRYADFFYGQYINLGTPYDRCPEVNELGFKVNDCPNMRYFIESEVSIFPPFNFALQMQSWHVKIGAVVQEFGNPITRQCRSSLFGAVNAGLVDSWNMDHDRHLSPRGGRNYDALYNCFR